MNPIVFRRPGGVPSLLSRPAITRFAGTPGQADPGQSPRTGLSLARLLDTLWPRQTEWSPAIREPSAFEAQVIQASFRQPVVALYYTAWSQPARFMRPHLAKLAREEGVSAAMRFVAVDLEALPALAESQQVGVVPTLVRYRNGRMEDRLVAYRDIGAIRAFLRKGLPAGNETKP